MSTPAATLPAPREQRPVGHLGRWGTDPLALLEEGATLGPAFSLRLWRRAVVGYSPEWNRGVLGDLDTFRSHGSMSALSPYLGAGVVHTDAPEHKGRRRALNPPFARRSLAPVGPVVADVVARALPTGAFDASEWSSRVVRRVLSATLCAGTVPDDLLDAFLTPLDAPLPVPFLPRPRLFRRVEAALAHAVEVAPEGTLAAAFRGLAEAGFPGGVTELRVALAAGYDTTAHTLALLLWHVAREPRLLDPALHRATVDEVLRLYPAGWLGSRSTAHDTCVAGVDLPRGTLVLYSPYLTHRDPGLWKDPLVFRPERFADPVPSWGHIPFAAGERTCLGRSYARAVLTGVLEGLAGVRLRALDDQPRLRAGITLAPDGPVPLEVW
ncbi:beta-carotene 2-hydroxylase CYP287A1 [Rhodococcus aerolatus]